MGKTGLPVSDSWMSMPAEEERGLRGLQVRGLQVRGSAGVYVHGVYSCVAGKGGSPVPAITQDYSLPPGSLPPVLATRHPPHFMTGAYHVAYR